MSINSTEKERRIHKLIKLDEKTPIAERVIDLKDCTVTFELLTTADWQNLRMATRMLNGTFQQRHGMRDLRQAVDETVNSLNVQFKDSSIQLETEFATSLFKRPKLVINVVVTEGGGTEGANGSQSTVQSGATSNTNNRSFNGGNASLPPASPRSSSFRSRSSSAQQRDTASMRASASVANPSTPQKPSPKFGNPEGSALARSSSGGYQSNSKTVSRNNSGLASVSSNDVDRASQTPGQKDEEIRALKEKQEKVELELQRVQEQFATFSSMQAPTSAQSPMYSNVGPAQTITPPPTGAAGPQSPTLRHSQSVMTKRGDTKKGAIGRTHSTAHSSGTAPTIKFNDDATPDSDSLDDEGNSSSMDDAGVNGSGAKPSGLPAFQQSAFYVNDRVMSGKDDTKGGSDLAVHNAINRSMTQPLEASQPAPRPRPRPRPNDGFAVPEDTGSPMLYNQRDKPGASPKMDRNWHGKNNSGALPSVSRTDSNLSANSDHFDQGLGAKQTAHRNNTMQLPARSSPSHHRSQSNQRSSPVMSHRDMHTQSVFMPGRTASQSHAQQPKERRVVMDGATVGECSFFHELLDMTKQERHDKLCELFAGRKNGDWLLRYNTEQNSYIITLKYIGTLLHIKIPQDETGTYELGEVAFSRLVDLLSYYSNHRLSEDIPIRLNECVRVQLPTLEGDAGYVVIGPKSNYGG